MPQIHPSSQMQYSTPRTSLPLQKKRAISKQSLIGSTWIIFPTSPIRILPPHSLSSLHASALPKLPNSKTSIKPTNMGRIQNSPQSIQIPPSTENQYLFRAAPLADLGSIILVVVGRSFSVHGLCMNSIFGELCHNLQGANYASFSPPTTRAII